MVSNLSLNQFAPNTPVDGMYVYMANEGQLHNVIVGADQELKSGDVVKLDAASTNVHAPVVLAAEAGDDAFGVVSYTPIQAKHVAGHRVGLAREHDVIWKTASGAVAVGDKVAFDSEFKVATASSGAYIGIALTPASEADELIQVELKFGSV